MRHTSSTASTADELRPMLERVLAGGPEAPLRLVVQRPGEAAIVATVGFHTISALNGTAEITYDVAPEHWRQGIATAACRAASAWGFKVRGWHRIQGTTLLANTASQRVLERCGYQREGVLRNYRIVRGVPTDYLMYAVIAGEKAAVARGG
jgi:RimJ/RimL family protein N-acetyltransferase